MNKTKNLTRSSFYTAITVLLLYFSTIMPIGKLGILAVSCCIIPLAILTTDIRYSILVYIASSLLSILLLGLRLNVFSYIIFFGIYGFVKLYIEKLRKLYVELSLKLVFYNISLFIVFIIYKTLFISSSSTRLPIYLIVIISEPIFLLCDYIITLFIDYVNRRFIKISK